MAGEEVEQGTGTPVGLWALGRGQVGAIMADLVAREHGATLPMCPALSQKL
jgi:hypothetical protein